ncbi:MAG TPA: exonuclease domain-containing protein [Methylotenera sp.]|nr:exonuclease domain-containing protein [Methylotenera sp.]
MHWLPDLTFLDIETTGGSHLHDRITEVALVKIEDGEISIKWETLINPGIPIPREITGLTGISNEMVKDAPKFEDIAGDLFSHLEGTVMAAHNCRFDHGFLKAEYKRMGGTLRQRTLCTVKLSRKLYPHAQSHSLDAIMKRFGLRTNARHRGMGDVQLMLDFLEAAKRDLGSVRVLEAINQQLKGPTLPAGIDDTFLSEIQDVPGVYLFYNETNLPLYIGKSTKLKSRVLNHFSSDHVTATEMELSQKIKRVEWKETAGELGALLLEAKLIKSMQPAYNRLLRKHKKLYAIQMSQQMNVVPWVKIVTLDEVDPTELEFLYGIFKTKKSAKELIYKLVDEHKLCCKVLGLEKGKGKCFGEHIGKCSGVCIGKEKHELHHLRLKTSLAAHKLRAWPFEGKVGIQELNPDNKKTEIHLFEQWCYLGTVDSDVDLSETINCRYSFQFDLDIYRLIGKAIDSASDILQFRMSTD